MPRVLLAIVLSTLVVVPGARAAQSLPVRPARPGDDVAHASLTEWWQVLAFDPASRTWVRIQFVAKPWPDLELWFRRGKDRKSTRLNSSHTVISYAVFCLKKKKRRDIK